MLFGIILLLLLNECKSDGVDFDFDYSKSGQRQWKKIFPKCGGKLQSPININCSEAMPINIPPLQLENYEKPISTDFKLTNTGKTVNLEILNINNGLPFVHGGMLCGRYIFKSLHFHWGSKNNRGSEHELNSVRYPMEVHLVHYNEKYKYEEALEEENGILVLAVFFKIKEYPDRHLNAIVDNLHEISECDTHVTIKSFPLKILVPRNLDLFYTYAGSLTTPPCNEVVTWVIYPFQKTISVHQLNQFRHLATCDNQCLVDNFRFVQPANDRKIMMRSLNRNCPT